MGINTVDELPKGETGICIVRSHGMEPNKIEEMTQNGFEVVDLTCLDVKKVQLKACELAQNGFFVIILGKQEHPEVKAISTNAKMIAQNKDNVFVAQNLEEIKAIFQKYGYIG